MTGWLKRQIKKRQFVFKTLKAMRTLLDSTAYLSSEDVDRAERVFYIQRLRPGMIVFDVGANIGELTLLFAHAVQPNGKIYAFEPGQTAFKRLTVVCEAIDRGNIILNNTAVSDQNGVARLNVYDSDHSSWNSLAQRPLPDYGITTRSIGVEEVPSITIDRYCEMHQISHIDLLKIDVEGAEYQVLLGATQMLKAKKIDCCIFEYGATTFDMGNHPDQIEAYLHGVGYRLANVIPRAPIFIGQRNAQDARFSMIIARRPGASI